MKISKILIINLIICCIFSAVITGIMVEVGVFGSGIFDTITKGMLSKEAETLIFFLTLGFLCFISLNLICLPVHIIKFIRVTKDAINQTYVDTKESIYTRDLPKYNSAVAGEIVDFKTTFQEEYLACIIELISKGYIIENEYGLIVDNSKSTEGLLRNEKYIIKNCTNINSNLYMMNNYEFYKELKEDMYDLGLYKKANFLKSLKNKITYYIKKEKSESGEFLKIKVWLISMILPIFFFMIVGNFAMMLLLYLIIIVLLRKNKLTPEGELEKEKMSKLKLFLEKEMDFQDKSEKERKLWERYSAFAVAFGLNSKMGEDIRSKIIKGNRD